MTARKPRLCIVVSHPIQYQIPLYRMLAESDVLSLVVCFLSDHGTRKTYDAEFGESVDFGVSVLDGYDHVFLDNQAPWPTVARPSGLLNLGLHRIVHPNATDVVLVHGWGHLSEWLAIAMASVRGIPYVLRGEAREAPPGQTNPTFKRSILGPLVRHAAACLPIGTLNRQFYLSHGVEPSRLVAAPYSVDNEWFAARGRTGRGARDDRLAALDLDPTRPVVMFAAKFQPWKRPLDVARAFDQMRTPANLIFVGEGPLRSGLSNYATGRPDVRILGFLDQAEIAEWYGVADVLVLPSEDEPWGLVVNEAMAAGAVPVVSDSVGCAPDLVTRHTGRVVPTADVGRLAQTLDELLGSPLLLASLREGARCHVQGFGIAQTAAGIEAATTAVFARTST